MKHPFTRQQPYWFVDIALKMNTIKAEYIEQFNVFGFGLSITSPYIYNVNNLISLP